MSEICICDAIADAVDEKRRRKLFPVKAILGPAHMKALFEFAESLPTTLEPRFQEGFQFMGLKIESSATPGIQIVCDEE